MGTDDIVCRNAAAGPSKATWTAGGTTTLKWQFGAAHVGDCSLWLSYDVTLPRAQQKFFKIANLPDCNKDDNKDVTINIPAWLQNGLAVMRWDWYALHVYPTVEFYSQCVDITVAGGQTELPAAVKTYTIPGLYPGRGNQDAGAYWNPYGATKWKMEGPPCAEGVTGNCCDTTGYQRTGFINAPCAKAGTTPPASPTPAPPAATPTSTPGAVPTPGAAPTPGQSVCEIYVVKPGDTLSTIAGTYQAKNWAITWQQLCFYNKPDASAANTTPCDTIDVGDNLVIPDVQGAGCKPNANAPPTPAAPTNGPANPGDGANHAVGTHAITSAAAVALSSAWVYLLA